MSALGAFQMKAIGVVTAMEVWRSTAPRGKYKNFADDPDASEDLMVIGEHIRLPQPVLRVSSISRDAAGKGASWICSTGRGLHDASWCPLSVSFWGSARVSPCSTRG
jgi:hypothetical protein